MAPLSSHAAAPGPLGLVRAALAGSGIDLVASTPIAAYDARAPAPLRSAALFPSARGVIVVGSAGRDLWSALSADRASSADGWAVPHPLDAFVARALDRADAALAAAGIGARRFEPTLDAHPALSFRALGELVGLGSMGPFGLLIHDAYGPWWALRGAWLVDAGVPGPRSHVAPCMGCPAPCVGDREPGGEGTLMSATPEVRARCRVGQSFRYDPEQIAYHDDREAALVALRARDER